MKMIEKQYKHSDITQKIIGAYYSVYNNLGTGFLEKCYEEALKIELHAMGLSVETQVPITVYYKGQVIGEYRADMIVEKTVLVELKAIKDIHESHFAQLVNYLRATEIEVGLLLNFGTIEPKPHRKIFENHLKKHLPQTPHHSSSVESVQSVSKKSP